MYYGNKIYFWKSRNRQNHFLFKTQIKNKLDNGKDNKLILLVPEQCTFDTEKKFLDIVTERGLLRGEVISFKRMANVVFESHGGRSHTRMNESGKNMLIYKILRENLKDLKYFNRVAKQQGFAGIISKMLTEFKNTIFPGKC